MREILFRGKRVDNDEWVEGYYVASMPLNAKKVNRHLIIENTRKGTTFLINPDTLGQFIGMFDKNGRKIFEGDILKVEYSDEKGDYCESQCIIKDMTDYMALWKLDTSHTIEVIGNIYDDKRK